MIALLACVSASLPTVGHLLAPMSLADRMSYSPYLITSVVDLCLAVACLALWRAAPDYPIFRTFGLYILIASAIQLSLTWAVRSAIVASQFARRSLLIATAGEAMHVRYRLWVRILVPLGLGVLLAGWYPALAYLRSLPTDVSQIMLAVMIVQGFRRQGSRDRRIPLAFTAFFLVRWLASRNLGAFLHLPEYIWIYGWRWSLDFHRSHDSGSGNSGFVCARSHFDRHEKLRLAAELAAGRTRSRRFSHLRRHSHNPGIQHSIGLQALWRSWRGLFSGAADMSDGVPEGCWWLSAMSAAKACPPP